MRLFSLLLSPARPGAYSGLNLLLATALLPAGALCSAQQSASPLPAATQISTQAAIQAAIQAATPAGLEATVASLLASPAAARAHWGISVVDTVTGAQLYARNDGELFEPASNAKLFTTAAALALLGPGFTMETRVVAEGNVSADGHLRGPLRLEGAGDPSLSGRTYPYAGRTERLAPPLHALDELAAQVAAAGIHAVDGPVIGDDTFFAYERYGSGWGWDDLQWEYGAPVSALTVNDNVRYLTVMPGVAVGSPLAAAWDDPFASLTVPAAAAAGALAPLLAREPVEMLALTTAAGTEPHLGVSREVDGGPLRIEGSLPAGGKAAHLAIALRDPAEFAAEAFAAALGAHGVTVSGGSQAAHHLATDTESFAVETRLPLALTPPAQQGAAGRQMYPPPAGRVVATRSSPPLAQLVTVTNKASQNLHAELLLRWLGKAEGESGSVVQGVRVVRQFLVSAGVNPQEFAFVDGSGLSPQDLVAPRAVTTLLVYAARQPWAAEYRASLPVGGVDGSLAGRFTDAAMKGRVVAKTGTLTGVNTLSGYLAANSGRSLTFSILCNDYSGEGSRAVLDRIVGALAAAY